MMHANENKFRIMQFYVQECQASHDHATTNYPTTLSLLMNSDGVDVFKSSKFSMWPVLFMINELPFSER